MIINVVVHHQFLKFVKNIYIKMLEFIYSNYLQILLAYYKIDIMEYLMGLVLLYY
jgi:hypothetical protein